MYYAAKRPYSKKTRDVLLLIILLLAIIVIISSVISLRIVAQSRELANTLAAQCGAEMTQVTDTLSKLSRVGGSHTTIELGSLRQHLYAAQRLTEITRDLYGDKMVALPMTSFAEALRYVDACESRLVKGQAIDEPLSQLRLLLGGF